LSEKEARLFDQTDQELERERLEGNPVQMKQK
jgi:hypothetical protein